ncbi:MAG: type pilus secretin family protein [Rhodocyclaceae bacterium]|nr:type pilus secretin family protein [Rhodocyclaceae bacterium]
MKLFKWLTTALAASCFALGGFASTQEMARPNSIEQVNAAHQGDDILVKIDLKEALAAPPAGFGVVNPARVAFDFPETVNGSGRNGQTVNEGDLKSFNIVQAGGRTRLVLNLVRAMNYSTRIEGKSLYVTLSALGKITDSGAHKATRFTEESAVGVQHAIRDIAFRRGKEGEGRIIVDLSDSGTGIDIRQQGSALVVDFLRTSLPENLRRRLDVTDFATPVTNVTTAPQGDGVRMTISPKGLWEHHAYQTDNQFVVEVKKIVEDPSKLVQGSKLGYQGPRVSINYQNGDVRALLRLMAEELGLNAVISETVSGTTTLVLKEVPADQVIDIIFQQKGLDMRKNGNVILIAPRDEIATREKLEFESKQQISDLEPMRTETFPLNYQKADDVAKILATTGQGAGSQRLLSKRGSVIFDTKSNTVFVNDIASKLEEVRSFLKVIDVGSRQVLIEARVVEASDSFNKNLGVRLNFLNRQSQQVGNSGIGIDGGAYIPPTRTSSMDMTTGKVTGTFTPGTQTTPQTFGVNLPSFAPTGGTIAFSLFNASLTRILNLELAALETDGGGKIISSPRVITANNVKAKIEDGTEVPYITTVCGNQGCTNTVSFKPAKLSLETTPQITPEGTVRMKLVIKKEEPDWTRQVANNPPIKSSTVETDVVVENGGTLVVGGVFKTDSSTSNERIPFFGDLPYVGFLFKYQQNTGSRRELLIFITPRIVNEQMAIR